MSDTEQILDRFTEQQGWDRNTQLELALRYIEDQQSPDGWEDFLTGIAETENAEDGLDQHLGEGRSEGELLRHLDLGHGIDPNTIEDDHDLEALHERAHDTTENNG